MATLRPFRAHRPNPEKAADVSAVPYDVVNTEEARQLAAGNPLSFLRVSRPELELADDISPYADEVYQRAADNFAKLKTAAPLLVEETPSLYVYGLQLGDHEQIGVAACASIDEYDADLIRKHERTRKDKEDDRTRHMLTLEAQTGPVFLTYRGRTAINQIIDQVQETPPLYDFLAANGVRHTIWRMGDDQARQIVDEFRLVPLLYIADGHHRAASASRARATRQAANPHHRGDEEYNYFLAVLFPAEQLRILPYNRLVKDLNGLSNNEFFAGLAQSFEVDESSTDTPRQKGEICMYFAGKWFSLTARDVDRSDPIRSLDVSLLQDHVLDPLLGIKDVRTDKRIDFVGGIRGTAALVKAVDDGDAALAFSLYPVSLDELITVSDANEIMPPKSTWFEPKLRDGLLSHLI